jgi:hypothetical protein
MRSKNSFDIINNFLNTCSVFGFFVILNKKQIQEEAS